MSRAVVIGSAIIFVGLAMPVSASAAESIKQFCKSKWNDDFRMLKYCMDQESAAKSWIDQNMDEKETKDRQVLDRCRNKWATDFSMIKYCIEQAAQGARDINKIAANMKGKVELKTIISSCVEKWSDEFGPDYNMIAYCMKQQKEALDSINSDQ